MGRESLVEIFMKKEHVRDNLLYLRNKIPKPMTELNYSTPFEFLVAVMLSPQTTDKRVNIVTQGLFEKANTPSQVVDLGEANLSLAIRTLGLFRAKAKHIFLMSEVLVKKFNSQVPSKFEDLIDLPGVGRKTAHVLLNGLFKQPVIAVDTHVFRVARRIGFSDKKTVLGVEKDLHKIIPSDYLQDIHNLLVLHGRYTCTAKQPKCSDCKISFCSYAARTPITNKQ